VVDSVDRIAVGCHKLSLAEWQRDIKRVARANAVNLEEAREALRWVEGLFGINNAA
jgi:hypothetical protein